MVSKSWLTYVSREVRPGKKVRLRHSAECVIPGGIHMVTKVNKDGTFHVGGNTAVLPNRVIGFME